MRKSHSKLVVFLSLGALLLAGVFTLVPRRSFAATLSSSIIGMFPKDVGEFAYADLKAARQFSWFSQLRDQALPSRFRQFEDFLASAGVDPNTQVEELAWGFIPGTDKQGEQVVGVALGQFNPPTTEQKFKAQKISFVTDRGFHLYSIGGGDSSLLFFFIDANTAAFGDRQALDKLLDVRTGNADSVLHSDLLGPLIADANGNGQFWAAMNRHYTQITLQQLLPKTDQFPQAAQVVDRVQAMFLDIQAGSGVDTTFQAVCATPDDANVLAAALQAGVLFRKYQATQAADTVMANALDSIRVTAAGDRLKISAPISQDQLTTMLRNGSFATKM
jgi:hypothetical protein